MKLSVIVPAYKEGRYIYKNLTSLIGHLDKIDCDYELILVIDGQVDNTFEEAAKIKSNNLKIFAYKKNLGKGYALRHGFSRSKGELVTFIDADMDLHPKDIGIFTKLIEVYRADIIIGSKRHPQSRVNYPALRKFQSIIYQLLIRILFKLNVKDTQTGLKLFRRQVLQKIMPRVLVKQYACDLEFLVVAHHLGFKKILEAPIDLKFKFTSTIKFYSIWKILLDTAAIYYRLNILQYYDQPAKIRARLKTVSPADFLWLKFKKIYQKSQKDLTV